MEEDKKESLDDKDKDKDKDRICKCRFCSKVYRLSNGYNDITCSYNCWRQQIGQLF